MSKNTHEDQPLNAASLHDTIEVIHYPDGTTETIRTVERGDDTTTIENHQQPDGLCANPWDLHPPMRIHVGYTGFETDEGALLCTQCFEHNKKLIDRKAMWRIPLIYDPKTF